MKHINILFSFFIIFSSSHLSFAQVQPDEGLCGTEFTATEMAKLDRNLKAFRTNGPEKGNDIYYVPITLYLVANSSGGGRFSFVDALDRFCLLNEQFEPVGIQFYLTENGLNTEINNTIWFEGGTSAQNFTMPLLYQTPNSLNIYIVQTANYGSETPLCGYYSPASDVVVVGKSCWSSEGITLMHEMGHYLSLPHTFNGIEGTDYACGSSPQNAWEKVDGSNCQTAGDHICDTGPDYISSRWQCNGQSQSNCLHVDPDGTQFFPSGTNPMSYANDACVTIFSNEQGGAMKTDIDSRGDLSAPYTHTPIFDVPTLAQPPMDAVTAYDYIYFNWVPAWGASNYIIQISKTASFNNNFIDDQAITDINQYWSTALSPNFTYYWRVKPYNEGYTCTEWTATGVFMTNDFAVGVNELPGLNSIEIHPNPVYSGQALNLTINIEEGLEAEVKLYTIQGQLMHNEPLNLNSGSNVYELNTQGLSNGLYLITIENENGTSQRKVVITN